MKTSMVLAAVAIAMTTSACGGDAGYDPDSTGLYVYNELDVGAQTYWSDDGRSYHPMIVDRFVPLAPGRYFLGVPGSADGRGEPFEVVPNQTTQIAVATVVVHAPEMDEGMGMTDQNLAVEPWAAAATVPQVVAGDKSYTAVFGWNASDPGESYIALQQFLPDGMGVVVEVGALKISLPSDGGTILDAYRVTSTSSELVRTWLRYDYRFALPPGTYELRRHADGTVMASGIDVEAGALTIVSY